MHEHASLMRVSSNDKLSNVCHNIMSLQYSQNDLVIILYQAAICKSSIGLK